VFFSSASNILTVFFILTIFLFTPFFEKPKNRSIIYKNKIITVQKMHFVWFDDVQKNTVQL